MAAADGTFHYEILLAAFQLAAAAVVLRAPTVGRAARGFAAALLGANAVIPLAAAVGPLHPAGPWARVGLAADYPTPLILLLLVLWFPGPRLGAGPRRLLTAALLGLAVFASGVAAFAPDPHAFPPWSTLIVYVATLLGYAVAVGVFAADFARSRRWEVQWMLAAIGLRAAEFAVFFASAADAVRFVSLLPGLAAAFAVARIALARGVPREAKLVLGLVLVAGLTLGGLRRWVAPDLGLQESLVTLSIGRPALMLIALAPPGLLAPFFRSTLVCVAAYAGAVLLARASGLSFAASAAAEAALGALAAAALLVTASAVRGRAGSPPPGPRASPPGTPPAVPPARTLALLAHLARRPPGGSSSRREIADWLGVLPRNVHRVVEATNRLPGAAPGTPLVIWTLERGRGNQVQHFYAATEEGRRVANQLGVLPTDSALDESQTVKKL